MPPNVDAPAAGLELRLAHAQFRDLEFRDAGATGDGSLTFTGHAAVFDTTTTLWEMDGYRVQERIARGAFDQVLATAPDVHLNINHDMARAIARTGLTGMGSLELSVDPVGLRVFARLDPEDPDVVALAAKMRRGIIDQMSFAFTIASQARVAATDPDGDTDVVYTIEQVGSLFDVCACAQGAYPTTNSSLRSRLELLRGRAGTDPAGLIDERRAERAPVEPIVEPVPAGGATNVALLRAKTRARAALHHHPKEST